MPGMNGSAKAVTVVAIAVAIFIAVLYGITDFRVLTATKLTPPEQSSPIVVTTPDEHYEQISAEELLFDAIAFVESRNRDSEIGDRGGSNGRYRIGEDYWTDGTEYGGVEWDYMRLVWSKIHCEQVMRWYWARYKATTDQQRAQMHNGGPRGPHKASTLVYWNKVKDRLDYLRSQGTGPWSDQNIHEGTNRTGSGKPESVLYREQE